MLGDVVINLDVKEKSFGCTLLYFHVVVVVFVLGIFLCLCDLEILCHYYL